MKTASKFILSFPLAFIIFAPLSLNLKYSPPKKGEMEEGVSIMEAIQAPFHIYLDSAHAAPACGTDDPFCLDKTAIDAELTPGKITNPNVALAQSLGKIISVGLGFIGVLFFLLLLYAGTRWMIARGNQEDVDKAKGTIEQAAIGLIVVAISYALVTFMVETLFSAPAAPAAPAAGACTSCVIGSTCPAGRTPIAGTCPAGQTCCTP